MRNVLRQNQEKKKTLFLFLLKKVLKKILKKCAGSRGQNAYSTRKKKGHHRMAQPRRELLRGRELKKERANSSKISAQSGSNQSGFRHQAQNQAAIVNREGVQVIFVSQVFTPD